MNIKKATDSPRVNESAETKTLGQVIAALSRQLNAERIGAGRLAELRRITGDNLPPAFWKQYLGGRTRRMAGT